MDPLKPESFNHKFLKVGENVVHYVDEGKSDNVIVCVHGFPDLWYGWRFQIPYLVSLGYRIIAVDLRGFGHSDSHPVEDKDLPSSGTKSRLGDIIAVLDFEKITEAIWFGHDWGGNVVWRAALWYPSYVRAIASVCTPYWPASEKVISLTELVKTRKNWMYQLYFRSQKAIKDFDDNTELFFNVMLRPYSEIIPSPIFSTTVPIEERTITSSIGVQRSSLLSQPELDYYVSEYSRNGFAAPLVMYRIQEIDAQQEIDAGFVDKKLEIPCLMITAGHDRTLPKSFADNMGNFVTNLTLADVEEAGHWVLVEQHAEVNGHLGKFLKHLDGNN
ncbi:Bifunctional epoxide hydrolase 2 [Smittium mucronatum]|uniref:Bifunctional epoxide hydrolase 2 n=1 Tax=Smittium mucronatum TaxID=133383 RepID=A0A1R0GXR8_9FUNG|nr:Bifunctional epoxide hydrolase 2 [Smittium mucronatum]